MTEIRFGAPGRKTLTGAESQFIWKTEMWV